MPTTNNPGKQPEPEEVNAYKADNAEKETVIMLATEFRLTEALRHIEAGRIVRVIPAPRSPAD